MYGILSLETGRYAKLKQGVAAVTSSVSGSVFTAGLGLVS